MKQSYQCIDCNHEFEGDSRKTDGTNCPECDGKIIPTPCLGFYCKECRTRPAVSERLCERC
jgi:DNA-directed RNA polymerase subunit RPC12/RpoP